MGDVDDAFRSRVYRGHVRNVADFVEESAGWVGPGPDVGVVAESVVVQDPLHDDQLVVMAVGVVAPRRRRAIC